MQSLKNRIAEEMTSDFSNALERNFEKAKNLVRLSKEGKIELILKDNLTGEEMILLYLIGKHYSQVVGYSTTNEVNVKELMEEISKPEGSILPWLKNLRDKNKIKQNKSVSPNTHYIPLNLIEGVLNSITKKLTKGVENASGK